MTPITVAVLGAGSRGEIFGRILRDLNPLAKVVAVADVRKPYRHAFAAEHALEAHATFGDWREFADRPKMCDAIVISTMDREHVGPAVACLAKGYHVLLEKPMATALADCQAIESAQRKAGTMVAVCHSMRYHRTFGRLKELVDSGRIGRLITMDQIEQVGWWHQAHSFVRGNWANEGRSTFMLMSKCCHDIDYIAHLIGERCLRVSSFGSLTYFRKENAPPGATDRCTDSCAVESTCPYSAIKVYVQGKLDEWPAAVCSPVHTAEAHLEAIKTGPYGRCVYRTDNDVVDHQVVAMEFERGVTATFTMTGFTHGWGRVLRLNGTQGEIAMDESGITLKTFADGTVERIELPPETGSHGGGDMRVVQSWLEAIEKNDSSLILTSAQESLRTHTIVFAAEQSRREKRIVEIAEMNPAR